VSIALSKNTYVLFNAGTGRTISAAELSFHVFVDHVTILPQPLSVAQNRNNAVNGNGVGTDEDY
jgi:hypothetical protein